MDKTVSKMLPNVSPIFPESTHTNVCKILVDEDERMKEWNRKAKTLNRQKERRRGIYNLTSWHVNRLRAMEERLDGDYAPFIQFIKWKGGIPPEEDNYDEDYEYLFEMTDVFKSLGGYEFFQKHNLSLPPCGVSI